MLFSRDGIPNPFHKTVQQVDEMANPQGRDAILDRGNIKHTLEGAGISDSSVTSEQFGGPDDREAEFNFMSLHINTVTTVHNGDDWACGTFCGPPPLLLQQRLLARHMERDDLLQMHNGTQT